MASIVNVFRHPDELPADVAQLFRQAESESIEFGLTWYKNLVDAAFCDHDGIRIFVLRNNGLPTAALPVVASHRVLRTAISSLSNYYTALYAPAITPQVNAEDLVPLFNAIRQTYPLLGSLRLAPMDPNSAGYRILLDAIKAAGIVPFQFYCFGNWFLKVDGRWADYLKGRSATFRSNIKRANKKFTADGGTLELILDDTGLARGLMAYEQVYAASWKVAEPFPHFVPGLIRACAARGWLRLGVAWLDHQPIAAQLWIVAGAKASIYKVAYHEKYKTYAPGTLVAAMLMEHVIDRDGVTEVDYLIGDDAYKKTWMSGRRERWGIVAYNPRSIDGLVGLTIELGGRVVKRLLAVATSMAALFSKWYGDARLSILDRGHRKYFKQSHHDKDDTCS